MLETTQRADQKQIDELFGLPADSTTAEQTQLPKGLSRETALAVLAILTPDDAISATECAERIGLSRVSARRYLEHLERTDVARVSLKYGVGRPERLYRLR